MSGTASAQCLGPGMLEVEEPPHVNIRRLEDIELQMAEKGSVNSASGAGPNSRSCSRSDSDGNGHSAKAFISLIETAIQSCSNDPSQDKDFPWRSGGNTGKGLENNPNCFEMDVRDEEASHGGRSTGGKQRLSYNVSQSAGSSPDHHEPKSPPHITVTEPEPSDHQHNGEQGSSDHQHSGEHLKKDIKVQFSGMISSLHLPSAEDHDTWRQIKSVGSAIYLRDQIVSFFQPSDNKLAMKLFGNVNALMKEKRRQQAGGNWVIHPCSNFRFYWDFFMLLLLIANLIILPIAISFFNDDLSAHWIVFNCVSDTVFIIDIIINFRTGVIMNDYGDEIVLDPKKIAKHYLKSWFILDLVSSIPLDYIFLIFDVGNISQLVNAGRALRILRLAKLLSLLRLLRLSRLMRYVAQWEAFLNFAGMFIRIFNLICFMLLIGHWSGCLQFLVPMLMEFPANSWIAINELQEADWWEQYTWSLFKALSHMLCIGYGRFPPQSLTDVWLTMVSMLSGATCYALFVGHATTLIQSFDASKRLYRDKFKQVEEYMSYRKFSLELRTKITDYYEHRYQGKMFDEDNILSELSECLKEEIVNYNCRALVAAVPFFTHADPNFVSAVISKLKYKVFQPGDTIIKEGTIGTKMYFIQEGIVDVITKEGEIATSLSDGSYFGEICLLTKTKRVANVRAETYCNVFSLAVEHFDLVLAHYPVMKRTMQTVATERLNKIGKTPSKVKVEFEAEMSELTCHTDISTSQVSVGSIEHVDIRGDYSSSTSSASSRNS